MRLDFHSSQYDEYIDENHNQRKRKEEEEPGAHNNIKSSDEEYGRCSNGGVA